MKDTFKQFKSARGLKKALLTPGWAVISATREAAGSATCPANRRANVRLGRALRVAGFDFRRITGRYKGVPQGASYLVAMSASEAVKWGRFWGQESVLVAAGLLYTDGTLNPVKPEETVVGRAAERQDFFSRISGLAFSVGLDFSQRIALNAVNK